MQNIEVEISLTGGQQYRTVLRSDAPLLRDLFVSLAANHRLNDDTPGILLQIPQENGHAAASFMSSSVLSVVTKPAVLIQDEQQAQPQPVIEAPASATRAAKFIRIEDFLTPDENTQLLEYALGSQKQFESSTTLSPEGKREKSDHRSSKVNFAIKDTGWKDTFINRLKPHLGHVFSTLAINPFNFTEAEIQLTATSDGDYFKMHADADQNQETVANRVVTFVYYFYRRPKGFSGGDLLIYDKATREVSAINPQNNCMIIFASNQLHEVDLTKCPSGKFADSRFTINGWLRDGSTKTAELA